MTTTPTLFHDKESGRYLVTISKRYIGYVQKIQERTPVLEGRILVGYSERTRWHAEDKDGRATTHRTRTDAVAYLVKKGATR